MKRKAVKLSQLKQAEPITAEIDISVIGSASLRLAVILPVFYLGNPK